MPEVAREIALIAVSGDLRTNYYYYFFYYYDDDDDENNAAQSDDCIAIRVSTALVRALLSYLSVAISVRERLFHDTAYMTQYVRILRFWEYMYRRLPMLHPRTVWQGKLTLTAARLFVLVMSVAR